VVVRDKPELYPALLSFTVASIDFSNMFIYSGKINYQSYAQNECATVVFPAGFALNDPVSAHWQWSTEPDTSTAKTNALMVIFIVFPTPDECSSCVSIQSGIITSVCQPSGSSLTVKISFAAYTFDCVIEPDLRLTIKMASIGGDNSDAATFTLNQQRHEPGEVLTTTVYTGKLNYLSYASNEMITFIAPAGITNGATACLNYQFTLDGGGRPKRNTLTAGPLRNVSTDTYGNISGTFDDGYYTYVATLSSNAQTANLRMTAPASTGWKTTTSALTQTDFRKNSGKKVRSCCQRQRARVRVTVVHV
jgi:hypothetical protein